MAKVCNLKGNWFWRRIVWKTVEIGCVEASLFGAEDVRIEVIAYHQCLCLNGPRLLYSLVEELLGGFIGSCILTEDDGIKIVE